MIDPFSITPMTAEQIEARRDVHPKSSQLGWAHLFETARSLDYPDASAARAADLWVVRGRVILRRIPEGVGWRSAKTRWPERMSADLQMALTGDLS